MNDADFLYAPDNASLRQVSVDIVHDNISERTRLADALQRADYRIGEGISLEELLSGDRLGRSGMGDVLLLDCEYIDAAGLARLAQLDMQFARMPMQMVVTSPLNRLDEVFACLDQTDPQILIDPTRAELLVALARAGNAAQGSTLREMSEDERMSLMRLSLQVDALAQRLDDDGDAPVQRAGLSGISDGEWGGVGSGLGSGGASAADISQGGTMASGVQPALPDPRHVRQVIRQRQARVQFFDGALFGDPAWDMLLDLTASRAEKQDVSVTSLCIASGVPATTALRWVKQMVEAGLFERTDDISDKRRAFIQLSDNAADAMARYFARFRTPETAA